MPWLGAHMSIAGGLHLAFQRIRKVRGEALQIFTRNERQWQVPPSPEEKRTAEYRISNVQPIKAVGTGHPVASFTSSFGGFLLDIRYSLSTTLHHWTFLVGHWIFAFPPSSQLTTHTVLSLASWMILLLTRPMKNS